MLTAELDLDDLTAAYIGLIDLYGEILNSEEKNAMPYNELSKKATCILLSSLDDTSYQEKMRFCLKASAWLGMQQLSYVKSRGQHTSHYKLIGIDEIKRSFLRSV